jgi:hypothetical protein
MGFLYITVNVYNPFSVGITLFLYTVQPIFNSVCFFAVPPQRPRVEYNTSQVLPGHNVTAQAGERAIVKCVSRYGNPPARLKWLLGKSVLPI